MAIIPGTINNDNLLGGIEDDFIDDGNGGNDTLNGAEGNDQITVTGGSDSVNGGTGTDTLIIDWTNSTSFSSVSQGPNDAGGIINGAYANGDGRFIGFSQIENIHFFGGSGTDNIITGSGSDNLNGNAGNDSLDVGRGLTDSANGGADTDRLGISFIDRAAGISLDLNALGNQLLAGAGFIQNFEGFTTATGSTFNDVFVTTNAVLSDTIIAGDGDDSIEVRNGSDAVNGGAGTDTLIIDWSSSTSFSNVSQGPNDVGGVINGAYANGDGRFVSFSGIENIRFTGGSGSDSIVSSVGIDALSGGGGNDTLDVGRGTTDNANGGAGVDRLGINFIDRIAGVNLNLTGGGNQLLSGLGNISNFEGFTTVTGSNFADIFVSTDLVLSDTINAGDGADSIEVRNGSDSVNGGAGTDTLIINWASSTSFSNVSQGPNDVAGVINGAYGNGDGRFIGFSQIENIHFFGGSGTDSIVSGTGSDNLNGNAGNDTLDVGRGLTDSANGGADIDRLGISFIDRAAGVSIDLNAVGNQLLAGEGTILNFEGFTTATGSNFNDVFVTTNAVLNDTIIAGDGNDSIVVRNGSDAVNGGAGTDTLIIDWSSSTSFSNVSQGPNDVAGVINGAYANGDGRFIGFSQIENIQFFGGTGNDNITGGGNDDVFSGGKGTNVLNGGAGNDTSSYANANAAVRVSLALTGSQITRGGGLDTLISVENITGSAFNDILRGSSADNIIDGGAGDDQILTGDGSDRLTGGDGNDILTGGAGDDMMTGGNGDDEYSVDSVGDIVIEAANAGIDTVRSSISYILGADVEELILVGANLDGTGNSLDNMIVGSNSANILMGLDGADILRGQNGRDILIGGQGDDNLGGGTAVDILTGGAGVDRFLFRFLEDSDARRQFADTITDFDQGINERIQVNLIDANTTADGLQNFEWISTAAFSHVAGEMRYEQSGGDTYIEGDVNGDGVSDFTIHLTGLYTLDASDIIGANDLFP